MQDQLYQCHCSTEGCYCATIKQAEHKITALYNRYLESRGLIRDTAQRGRSRSLEVTEEGEHILSVAISLWQQAQQEFERQVGKPHAQQLLQLLEEIISL